MFGVFGVSSVFGVFVVSLVSDKIRSDKITGWWSVRRTQKL